MIVALPTLNTLLEDNVLEIKFTRRKPKQGQGLTRRMLCTNSYTLLNSSNGRNALGFNPTNKSLKFNPTAKNLIVAWDLFKRSFRLINADNCELISTLPADDSFWLYYNDKLAKMSPREIDAFYDS